MTHTSLPQNPARKFRRTLVSLGLALILTCTSCSPQPDSDSQDGTLQEYTLIRTTPLKGDDESIFRSIQISGDKIHCGSYSYEEATETSEGLSAETICTFSAEGELLSKFLLPLGDNRDSVRWYADDEDNIYIAAQESTENAETSAALRLYKFDATGALCLEQEFDRLREYPAPNNHANDIATDKEGRICVLLYDTILLFDESGIFRGSVNIGETLSGNHIPLSLVTAPDGTVCVLCQTDRNDCTLARINFDNKAVSPIYTGLPPVSGGPMAFCSETEFLLCTEEGPCLYRGETGEQTTLFTWLSRNLLNSSVKGLTMTGEGTLLVAVNERMGTGISSIELMEFGAVSGQSSPEEAAQSGGSDPEAASAAPSAQTTKDGKTIITLAAITLPFYEKNAIIEFNKGSDRYRVDVVEYLPYGWNNPEELKNAQAKMEMEMALDSKSYDLISLSYLNMENLAEKDIFEDLYPFLDREGGFERDDFFESILNAYTVNGKLISIPDEFSVNVLLGKTSDLGDRHGWTLRELLDYNNAHPETSCLVADSDRILAAYALLWNGNDSFIRMEDGEVVFDRGTCEDVLKLLKDHEDTSFDTSRADRLQQGESLLTSVQLYSFDGLQLDRARFGESMTWIGYPDVEGNCQVFYEGHTEYAISSHSDCKEGAWEYLEYYLGHEQQFVFPSRTAAFEEMASQAVTDQYVLDADGNIRLDENGNPELKTTSTYIEGGDTYSWSFTFGPVTEEDVEQIRQIVESGGKAWHNTTDEVIYQAVMEEGVAYFADQKSLDIVVDILENRLRLYLQEQ